MKSVHERLKAKAEEITAMREPIRTAARAGKADVVDRLVVEYDTLTNQLAQLEREAMLLNIGLLICEYGRRDLWRMLWCRYAFDDVSGQGWYLAEDYREHDELRFVYGGAGGIFEDWRAALARLDAADPETATGVVALRAEDGGQTNG